MLLSLYSLMCLYACLTMLAHAHIMRQMMTDGVLEDLLPDLDQKTTELLNRLR